MRSTSIFWQLTFGVVVRRIWIMPAQSRIPEEIAKRLKALRLALGFREQGAFADALGITRTAYNSWETGAQRPGLTAAVRVVDLFGVTLDFIYLGDLHGLPENLRKNIIAELRILGG